MSTMTLRFDNKGSNIRVSNTVMVDLSGGTSSRRHAVLFRIDGRNVATEGYRVDRGGIMGWEAVDGGKGPATLKEARALAARYLAAIVAECTLTPKAVA